MGLANPNPNQDSPAPSRVEELRDCAIDADAGHEHPRRGGAGRRELLPERSEPVQGKAQTLSSSLSLASRLEWQEQTCLGPYLLARSSGFDPRVAYSCQLQYHEKRSEGRPSRAASPSPRYMPSQYSLVPYLPPQTTVVHRDAAVAAVPSQVTGAAAKSNICDDDANLAVASTARGGEKTGDSPG